MRTKMIHISYDEMLEPLSQSRFLVAWIVVRYQVKIVHVRSYVASGIALFLEKLFGIKFVFNMRSPQTSSLVFCNLLYGERFF